MSKKELQFIRMNLMLPACVAQHIRKSAYDYQLEHEGNLKEIWPFVAQLVANDSPEVKNELVDAGLLSA